MKTGTSAVDLQPFIEQFYRYEEESAEAEAGLPHLRKERLQLAPDLKAPRENASLSTQSLRQSAPAGFVAVR